MSKFDLATVNDVFVKVPSRGQQAGDAGTGRGGGDGFPLPLSSCMDGLRGAGGRVVGLGAW